MKSKIPTGCLRAGAIISTVLLIACTASAQKIFVANWYAPGTIYQFTPGSSPGTFYSGGLGQPEGVVFDSSGNLFVADSAGDQIDEFSGGTESTFALVHHPVGLAFGRFGHLFVTSDDPTGGVIFEVTPGGSVTTFATGLNQPPESRLINRVICLFRNTTAALLMNTETSAGH